MDPSNKGIIGNKAAVRPANEGRNNGEFFITKQIPTAITEYVVTVDWDNGFDETLAEENTNIDTATTESVVTVDWENGFVETSAKENTNVNTVFKELLSQAKVKYSISPVLRRKRRQSLPLQTGMSTLTSSQSSMIPSMAQLQHLQQIRDRHGKRNSCVVS
ncbi:hypothetical protein WA026_020060 [Henosepilachna vigintioctopunctata]|uniref:Uncharacterized protein n=1 Tax=Henosepilachna vigintioctopunctata TaxID=420089 RepID=A0AAW1U267_9CUCU